MFHINIDIYIAVLFYWFKMEILSWFIFIVIDFIHLSCICLSVIFWFAYMQWMNTVVNYICFNVLYFNLQNSWRQDFLWYCYSFSWLMVGANQMFWHRIQVSVTQFAVFFKTKPSTANYFFCSRNLPLAWKWLALLTESFLWVKSELKNLKYYALRTTCIIELVLSLINFLLSTLMSTS